MPDNRENLPPRYVNLAGQAQEEERLGCADLLAAFAGMGCATVVRAGVIGGALLLLYLAFQLVGWVGGGGSHTQEIPLGGGGRVLSQGLDCWPLVLLYLFDLKEQLGGRVVNELHARAHLVHEPEAVSICKALHHDLHDGKGHLAERQQRLIAVDAKLQVCLCDTSQTKLFQDVDEQTSFHAVAGEEWYRLENLAASGHLARQRLHEP